MSDPAPSEEPRAYSYMRFSTLEQGKGDSLNRQTTMAREWTERRGVLLDTELNLTDRGMSAYHGDNRDVGALGAFLNAVRDGAVPVNSWLLVESLDRISREPAIDASFTMQDIIRAGVTVVDLSDDAREYNLATLRGDNGMSLMMMVMMFSRANNESTMKGSRVAAAFSSKRTSFGGTPVLDRPVHAAASWVRLRWDEQTKAYAIIEERGVLVREMFELTEKGWGQHRIARDFNARGLETWGAGGWKAMYWHRSYVRKILSNRAAIGVFTPHLLSAKDPLTRHRTRTALPTIDHRLPAVVDRELFERVHSRLEATAARGRNSNKEPRSIFAGVLKCQYCDGTVTRVSKGKWVYLVCAAANARGGKCKYEAVPYQQAEDSFCGAIHFIIDDAPRGRDTGELEEAIRDAENLESAYSDEMEELLGLVIKDRSRTARERLNLVETQMDEARNNAAELNKRLDSMTSVSVKRKLDSISNVLSQPPLNIAEANRVLKQAIRKMVLYAEQGEIDIYWNHTDEPQRAGGIVTNRGPFGPWPPRKPT